MDPLDLFRERFRMRSVPLSLMRLGNVAVRYGLDSRTMENTLADFVRWANALGITPTLPVTASVVGRHPKLFRDLLDRQSVELAVHGYRHVDYTSLEMDRCAQHLTRAVELFQKHRIPFQGIRFPFLRVNESLLRLLPSFGFVWDSSEATVSDFSPPEGVGKRRRDSYEHIMDSYAHYSGQNRSVLPRFKNGLMELPVSLPDDDILLERLGLSRRDVQSALGRMQRQSEEGGGLVVYQLHPERFPWFRRAFQNVLKSIESKPWVWRTTLSELSAWWRERSQCRMDLKPSNAKAYRLSFGGSARMHVLMKNPQNGRLERFWLSWFSVPDAPFEIHGPKKPVIGVLPGMLNRVSTILSAEGFPFEPAVRPDLYSVFLGNEVASFSNDEGSLERYIKKAVDDTPFPLIRLWRWPKGKRCSLSVTGDVDAIDLHDYVDRFHG